MFGQVVAIRPIVGYERGALLGIQRRPGIINRFHSPGTGKSYSNTFWLGIDVGLDDDIKADINLSVRLALATSSGRFISDLYNDTVAIDRKSRRLIGTTNQFLLSSAQTLFQLEGVAKYNLGARWVLLGGLWGRYRALSNIVETEKLLAPEDAIFLENNTNQRTDASEYLAGSSFRGGALFGISRTFQVTRWFEVTPEISARVDAVAIAEGLFDRRAMSFGGGLGFAFDFSPDPDSTHTSTPLVIDTLAIISSRSHIETSVDLFSTDSLGRVVDVAIVQSHKTLHRQYLDLPPLIFFDRGSDRLPERYRQLQGPADTAIPALNDRNAPAALYHDILNILGRRMRDLSSATVQLAGIPASGESSSIVDGRIARVRDYLHDIWGIDPDRVVAADASPLQGVRQQGNEGCLVILPSTPKLVAPVLTQWIINDRIIPNIGLNKRVLSEMGVREWSLVLRQREHELRRISSRDQIGSDIDAAFSLAGIGVDSSLAPLVAELEIADYAGGRQVARDSIHLMMAENDDDIGAEVRTYILPEPVAESSRVTRKVLIANICSVLRDGARVSVRCDSVPGRHNESTYLVARTIVDSVASHTLHPLEICIHLEPTVPTGDPMMPDEMLIARAVRVEVDQKPDPASR